MCSIIVASEGFPLRSLLSFFSHKRSEVLDCSSDFRRELIVFSLQFGELLLE